MISISEEDIENIASMVAQRIQKQYPKVDYLLIIVKDEVINVIREVIKSNRKKE